MNMIENAQDCFRNSTTFKGRTARLEFWQLVLFIVIVNILLSIINSVVFGPEVTESLSVSVDSDGNQSVSRVKETLYSSGWLGTVFGLVVLLPFIAISVRRLHDRNRSGWFLLTPVVGFLISWIIMFFNRTSIPIDTTGLPPEFPTEIVFPNSGAIFLVSWLIGVSGIVILIVWLARQGTPGPNRFGPNPNEVPS